MRIARVKYARYFRCSSFHRRRSTLVLIHVLFSMHIQHNKHLIRVLPKLPTLNVSYA